MYWCHHSCHVKSTSCRSHATSTPAWVQGRRHRAQGGGEEEEGGWGHMQCRRMTDCFHFEEIHPPVQNHRARHYAQQKQPASLLFTPILGCLANLRCPLCHRWSPKCLGQPGLCRAGHILLESLKTACMMQCRSLLNSPCASWMSLMHPTMLKSARSRTSWWTTSRHAPATWHAAA